MLYQQSRPCRTWLTCPSRRYAWSCTGFYFRSFLHQMTPWGPCDTILELLFNTARTSTPCLFFSAIVRVVVEVQVASDVIKAFRLMIFPKVPRIIAPYSYVDQCSPTDRQWGQIARATRCNGRSHGLEKDSPCPMLL